MPLHWYWKPPLFLFIYTAVDLQQYLCYNIGYSTRTAVTSIVYLHRNALHSNPLRSLYQQPPPLPRPPALVPPKLEVLDLLHAHGHEAAPGGGAPQELQVLLRRGGLG